MKLTSILVILTSVAMSGCVSAPVGKPLVEAPVTAELQAFDAVWKLKLAEALNVEIGPAIKSLESKIEKLDGVVVQNAEKVDAMRDQITSATVGDQKPQGTVAMAINEIGSAWPLVVLVLGAIALWQWGLQRRYHKERNGLAGRLAENGKPVRE